MLGLIELSSLIIFIGSTITGASAKDMEFGRIITYENFEEYKVSESRAEIL